MKKFFNPMPERIAAARVMKTMYIFYSTHGPYLKEDWYLKSKAAVRDSVLDIGSDSTFRSHHCQE